MFGHFFLFICRRHWPSRRRAGVVALVALVVAMAMSLSSCGKGDADIGGTGGLSRLGGVWGLGGVFSGAGDGIGDGAWRGGRGGVLPSGLKMLEVHPLGDRSYALSRAADSLSGGSQTFEETVHDLARDGLSHAVELRLRRDAVVAGVAAGGGTRYGGDFFIGGVRVYGAVISAIQLPGGEPLVTGLAPSIGDGEALRAASMASTATSTAASAGSAGSSGEDQSGWPDLGETTAASLRALLATGLSGGEAAVGTQIEPERVWVMAPGGGVQAGVVASWRLVFLLGGRPYEVVADHRGPSVVRPLFLTIDGEASVYPESILDTSLVTFPLAGLLGDGTLSSDLIKTVVPTGFLAAHSTSGVFNYPPSDTRFAEASAYAHTDQHIRWLIASGGATYGALPINVMIHQKFSGSPNNALFVPALSGPTASSGGQTGQGTGVASPGESFTIELGDGDGKVLANLATDSDVPSHEAGHYFIYRYLKATTGESLAVHEGLADLLVFLHKEVRGEARPACLGESICPVGTTACIESGCLRTADNSWADDGPEWRSWSKSTGGQCCGHKHGQDISGLVWDMVKGGQIVAADAATMTMVAVSYLGEDAGFRGLLLSLLVADKTLYGCAHETAMRGYMDKRNLLSTFLGDIKPGCGGLPAPGRSGLGSGTSGDVGSDNGGGTGGQPAVAGGGRSSSGGKKGIFGTGCGVVGAGAGTGSGLGVGVGVAAIGVVMAVPLMVVLMGWVASLLPSRSVAAATRGERLKN